MTIVQNPTSLAKTSPCHKGAERAGYPVSLVDIPGVQTGVDGKRPRSPFRRLVEASPGSWRKRWLSNISCSTGERHRNHWLMVLDMPPKFKAILVQDVIDADVMFMRTWSGIIIFGWRGVISSNDTQAAQYQAQSAVIKGQ